ncbi:Protein tyrosine phosphatase, putative [Shewanella piezotolerans WP3]|uniref:Protein tyrosine phosphatase, putative n=1 Tax=Shewanella piezotolerans (strain WP3 / JCM 13877) TaxID=225849 RepID=B8CMR3_SHEPW|nr:protein-tyrosine-phosphatase [Shewanella piezotolerans]ACJ29453.1 Protein tyrosine phosphatase, putative [Shewanella piezotolerans WP3]
MNILFLCTANKQRSKTAEELVGAADKSNQYKSAGLSAKYVAKAGSTLCTNEQLEWADKIYVFETTHIERIQEHTGNKFLAKITNLQIEDKYQYFQRELVLLILERCDLALSFGFKSSQK